jgi:hypothetical protein
MEEMPTGEVIVRIDRARLRKLLAMLLGCVAIMGFFAVMIVVPDMTDEPPWFVRTIGGIGFVFFGFGLAANVALLQPGASGLTIDADGIVDRTSYLSAGRVRWADISGVALASIYLQDVIVIGLHDPAQFVKRGNPLQRRLKAMNMKLVGSPVVLNLAQLDGCPEELLEILQRFQERAAMPADAPGLVPHEAAHRISHTDSSLQP